MATFSTPALTETIKATLESVVAELAKQGITASEAETPWSLSLSVGYLTMFVVEEATDGHRMAGSGNFKFPRLHSRTDYRNTLCAGKTLKGESKGLVAKLVASVVERCRADEADIRLSDANKIRQEGISKTIDELKTEFPLFARNISANGLEFKYITPDKARAILAAIQAAGINL